MKLSDLNFERGTYLAFELSEASRAELLKKIPPFFSKVICHHVTIEFALDEKKLVSIQEKLGSNPSVAATGHVSGKGIECFTITMDGKFGRPDGSYYHVTESLEPPHKPFESNELLKSNHGLPSEVFNPPIRLTGSFKLIKK